MVRLYSFKKNGVYAHSRRSVKILGYLSVCKMLASKILPRLRAWHTVRPGCVELQQGRSLGYWRDTTLTDDARSLNISGLTLDKFNLLGYSVGVSNVKCQTNSLVGGSVFELTNHLTFYKKLSELFMRRGQARFFFSTGLMKFAPRLLLLKLWFGLLVVVVSITLSILGVLLLVLFCSPVCYMLAVTENVSLGGGLLDGWNAIWSPEYWYFFNFFLEHVVQQLSNLVYLGGYPLPMGEFHVIRWSWLALFIDWELLYSYTELFESASLEFAGWGSRVLFLIGILGVVLLLCVMVVTVNVVVTRNDFWNFFFNFSYHLTMSHRFQSLEFLNQLFHGRLMRLFKNKSLFVNSNFFDKVGGYGGTKLKPINIFCLEYYCIQTVGGVTGFVDLFPAYTTYFNSTLNLRIKIKTFNFFSRLREHLGHKIKLMGVVDSGGVGHFISKKLVELKRSSVKVSRGSIPAFLSPRLYLEHSLAGFFRHWDWLFDISRLGDYGVFKMRHYFFQKAVVERDPWDFFDNGGGRGQSRAYRAAMPHKINWYGRELNSVVASQTIMPRFKSKSLVRFTFSHRNLINDFSFWKPEINSTGRQIYSSRWDLFSVENQFDINPLRVAKFDVFERFLGDDEEDESQLEYVVEESEAYFEDGLLHKDFELIFFDHEVEDLIVQGQLDPLFTELGENPKLKALLNNESLIYRAGQEGDHLEKTTSHHYNSYYSLEYGGLSSYKSRTFDSFYDDLSDFLAVSGSTIFPTFTGIPAVRSLFYWGGNVNTHGNTDKNERLRLGRLFYSYWAETNSFLAPNYYHAWSGIFFVSLLSGCAWWVIFVLGSLWSIRGYLPELFFWVDILVLLCFLFICLILTGLLFLILTGRLLSLLNLFYVSCVTSLISNYTLFIWNLFLSFLRVRSNHLDAGALMPTFKLIWVLSAARGVAWGADSIEKSGVAALHFNHLRVLSRQISFDSTRSPLLHFFFLAYHPFTNFSVFYGISNYKIVQKIIGLRASKTLLNYTPAQWNLREGAQYKLVSFLMPMSRLSRVSCLYFFAEKYALVDGNRKALSPATVFYDFQIFSNIRGLGSNNFLFGLLFKENLRILTKLKWVGRVNLASWFDANLLANLQSAAMLRLVSNLNRSNLTTGWATFLADMVFTSSHLPYNLLGPNNFTLRTKVVGVGQGPITKFAPVRELGARKRARSLQFFENRTSKFSRSLYLAAYENFLRLFFSKDVLRSVYGLRAGRGMPNVSPWSYTSNIKFINFATPLQKGESGGWGKL